MLALMLGDRLPNPHGLLARTLRDTTALLLRTLVERWIAANQMANPNIVKVVHATVIVLTAGKVPTLRVMCDEQDRAACPKYMIANDDAEIGWGKFHER